MPINHDMMHSQSRSMFEKAGEVLDGVAKLKERVAELEKEKKESQRVLWLARAERYEMREFIAREEANMHNHIEWRLYLRKRTYDQWVDQLLRIANLANKLQNKCRAKAEEYK